MVASDSIALTGCVRDPHILRTQAGDYLMVATDMRSSLGWASNRGIVLMRSRDLIHWEHHTVNCPQKYAGTNLANVTRVWAPQTIYDEKAGKYMVYFSLLTNDGTIPYDRVYWAYANEDFSDLEGEPQVLFDFHAPAIDTDIVQDRSGEYHLFFKTEQEGAHKGIRQYVFRDLHAPDTWTLLDGFCEQTKDNVEGAGVFPLIDGGWCLMYDCYTAGHYQFTRTDDLRSFRWVADTKTSGAFTPRHGTVIQITPKEYKQLTQGLEARRKKALAEAKNSFTTGDKTFLLDGKPFVVKAAEIHYPRIPRPYWEHRIKMCKALGMNTICIYIFWNIHEQREGQFDFSGQNDVAEFCRLAKKNGMYVIVRPGPYVCAEWEMGGLPWWLLKKKDIRLRELDPYFMSCVDRFEEKVAGQLAPLTIQNGGPIIMVQVENEYGSYGKDKPYVSAIRDIVRKSGFDKVSLFQCDWSSNFLNNGLDDLTWTMNFGTGANIDQQFKRLGEVRPNAPKMCSEFWSGWFDKWGARHETRPAKDMVEGMDEMLSKGISFSLYMTHGGTSFGHWAGANSPGFQPDVTSYDYDAPINEWGLATPKFYELQKMMAKYNDGKKLPAVPKAPMQIIKVPEFKFTEYKPLSYGIGKEKESNAPQSFEDMNMGWGTMVYETQVPAIQGTSTLTGEFHDFAQIYVNGKYVGKIDRVKNEKSLELPAMPQGAQLTIVVEGMGRINFGRAIKDYKGIIGNVTLTTQKEDCELALTPTRWNNSTIADDYQTAVNALAMPTNKMRGLQSKAGYYRGYFNLKKVGDTFINMEAFGKGQVYVNGHALGRFWQIGPQQTLYLPGCWLKKGKNEVIVLDVVGPKGEAGKPGSNVAPTAFCQDHPELDKLNLEKSNKHNAPGHRLDLNSATPVLKGEFKAGNGWQTIKLDKPVTGRYFAIQAESSQSGDSQIAIAEVYLQDASGNRIDRNNWVAFYADSEKGNSTLDKMFDLQESTYWQTEKGANFPHLGIVDMGKEVTISAFEYLPRAEQGAPGSVKAFKLYVKK